MTPEIRGHEAVMARLARIAARRQPHHAYVFHGEPGVGRRLVALWLAMALNCEAQVDGAPCGACPSCRRIASETDGDVRLIRPTTAAGKGRDEVGASMALAHRIDTVRDVQGHLAYRATPGRFRVVIFDDAERMNDNAANALLKTLEEPPEATVIVLITRRLGQMLPTVRSRCIQIGFSRLATDEVARFLVECRGADPGEAAVLAAASGGSIGRAVTLSIERIEEERALLRRFLDAAGAGTTAQLELAEEMEAADRTARRAGDRLFEEFLNQLAEVLRDAVAAGAGAATPARRPDCADLAAELSARYDPQTLLRGFDAVQRARDRLERYLSPRLVAEALLLEIE